MRTHTTFTDIRRIMKLHNDGFTPEQISDEVFIAVSEVKFVIDRRTKKTRKSKNYVEPTGDATDDTRDKK